MIRVYNSYEDFSAVKEQLHKRLQHPFLMRYIETPVVDENKLLLLYSILKGANLHIEQIQHYAVTIMLVQIALDTHEKVSDKANTEATESHKQRQLTVLAGDYYSGLYYYLLAENHDIMLIRALAEGIKEINEQKIKLYQHRTRSVTEVIACIEVIESSLLQKTCNHFHALEWKQFASAVLAMRRISSEYKQYKNQEYAPVFAVWEQLVSGDSEQINNLYESYMRDAAQQLHDLAMKHTDLKIVLNILQK